MRLKVPYDLILRQVLLPFHLALHISLKLYLQVQLEADLQEFATANGYASVDEFIGTNTREEYKEYYMFEDVLAFLVENAVVTDK